MPPPLVFFLSPLSVHNLFFCPVFIFHLYPCRFWLYEAVLEASVGTFHDKRGVPDGSFPFFPLIPPPTVGTKFFLCL